MPDSNAYKSKAIQIAQILRKIDPERIIFFGSAAAKNVTDKSDIDICVITPGNPLEIKKMLWGLLRKGGYDWSIEPDIHVSPPAVYSDYLRRNDPFIVEVAKGKTLYERQIG